jgi:hypothetical protein
MRVAESYIYIILIVFAGSLAKPSDTLNTLKFLQKRMSSLKLMTKEKPGEMRIAVGILVAILIFTMFIVGYDQGHLFSIAQGQEAFDNMWIHEFTHDMRHAAGFPCH